jgi:hypothetical protein
MENEKPKKDTAAFPLLDSKYGVMMLRHEGMSLRDYFAAKALQGMLANSHFRIIQKEGFETEVAWAYKYADEMLKARDK